MSDSQKAIKYKRIILKLSGEFLTGSSSFGLDPLILDRLASDISDITAQGVEVGVVIGGGNLFRGKVLSKAGIGRVTADHMGMLATVMNGLALRDSLEKIDLPARIMSAIPMLGVVDSYDRRKALTHLREKKVVIFSAGTGNPFFTTDTAACLRAIEINANVVLKATKVSGVYSADPYKQPQATRYAEITYDEVLNKNLEVMDLTAICLCRDHSMPLHVFNIAEENSLQKIISGQNIGTIIHAGDKNAK